MEISLIQGILLFVVAFVCGLDQIWEAFFWFRPMVVAFLAGIVLGDITLGVQAGAIAELAYLGLLTVGGTVPPDPLMAGMMTVVIAFTTGQSPETALGLALPFALLAQWVGILFNTFYVAVAHRCDKHAADGDYRGLTRTVLLAMFFKAFVIGLDVFLCAFALQSPIQSFVETFPEWLINGFSVAGGILPAVGLGLLLMVIFRKDNAPYFFIGFVMATFMDLPNVLPIAIVGAAVAFIVYQIDKRTDELESSGPTLGGTLNGSNEGGI
jgi:PTS system galactosamine-specific IIC component